MIETFERSGIRFQYPSNWEFEDEVDGDDWAVTLQTPGSGLLIVTYRDDGPEPAELADEAVEALRDDYEDLDSEIAIEKLAGQTAVGYDVDFLTQVTAVTGQIRTLETPEGALLLFWQVSEKDREHYQPLFAAIFASVTIG